MRGQPWSPSQDGYSAGIIPGGDNWYVTAGADSGQDLYELTGVTLPFGTSETFFASVVTQTGDAFIIWGDHGGDAARSECRPATHRARLFHRFMEIGGETIAGMTLIPGTYTFSLPNDTITLEIGSPVPEPASWAMMLIGFAGLGFVGYRRARAAVPAV